MVMGGESRSKGRGFESRHCILDGHFSHIFVVKICNVCLKRPKINEKEAGVDPFKKEALWSVGVFPFYSDDPGSNATEVLQFFIVKNCMKK